VLEVEVLEIEVEVLEIEVEVEVISSCIKK
jgi:hypothetical protein